MVYSQASLDTTFAALADPTRRAILTRLATGDRAIGELAARIENNQPAVSKHIRVLERAGHARIRREGRVRRTSLVAAPMRDAQQWLERYRRFWEFQLDQLAAYLEEPSPMETDTWQHEPLPKEPRRRSKSGARSARRGSASSTRGPRRKS